eukprot:TRINITY_DN1940_c0_g1_i3.p1 TRINITY_DN1940_c0_g1~~TRINITY_DN1940_c0_g1_i3.p1  ORF type:complete len:150 (-),score=25.44 TRINITY_DN1940_c0_g1_i3:148-597(-)
MSTSLVDDSFPSSESGSLSEGKHHPVQSKLVAAKINGIHTEIVLNVYSDQIFVIITQNQKLGTLICANKVDGDLTPSGTPNYSMYTVLGKRDDTISEIYARQLVQFVGNTDKGSRPLLLAISLLPQKDENEWKSTFNAVMNLIADNRNW